MTIEHAVPRLAAVDNSSGQVRLSRPTLQQLPIKHVIQRRSFRPWRIDDDDISQEIAVRRLIFLNSGKSIRRPAEWERAEAKHILLQDARKAKQDPGERRDLPLPKSDKLDPWHREIGRRRVIAAERLDYESEGAIRHALDSVAPREKLLLELHYRDGLNINEIAARLGVASRQVSKELRRAKSAVRLQLQRHKIYGMPDVSRIAA